jgi:hypothetical protein
MTIAEDPLESLERTINEIDALEAIYGNSSDDETDAESSFCVVSLAEMETARAILEQKTENEGKHQEIPTLELEIKVSVELDDGRKATLLLRCRMPPGYPNAPLLVAVSADGLRRSLREELSSHLTKSSESMAGSESTMGLVEELKEIGPTFIAKERVMERDSKPCTAATAIVQTSRNSRRWIWVHHIKDADRRKSIVSEARDHKLGGYLKHGYPGIVVIEGLAHACDEFVAWVKGNKSRPGGFGRNWGHHVRGQVDLDDESRSLPAEFRELEDMAVLGSLCREHGLEAEFLEFVMQHKVGTG